MGPDQARRAPMRRAKASVAADDRQDLTGDVARTLWRREKDNGWRDLLGLRWPLHRGLLAEMRNLLRLLVRRVQGRPDRPGRDGDIGRAYLRLGRELMVVLMGSPTITRLYLQESRAPAVHARVPVRELEREVAGLALRVTQAAFSHGVIRQTHPQISTLAVIGAAERLLTAHLDGALEVQPAHAVQELIRLVLEGLR